MITVLMLLLIVAAIAATAVLVHNDTLTKHERLVNRLLADRQNALDEAAALRKAAFPQVTKAAEAQQSDKPLTREEMISLIWADHRMSTREKLRRLRQLANTQQKTRDQLSQMESDAQAHDKALAVLQQRQKAANETARQMIQDAGQPSGGHHQSNY
jgi:hypothetical protein